MTGAIKVILTQARVQYTCTERTEDLRLDSDGHLKSEAVDVPAITFATAIRIDQLVEHKGSGTAMRE